MTDPLDQESQANSTHPPELPKAQEWLWVWLLLGGLLLLDLATYNDYPQVWCDEVWFSEPAVNLVSEGVFHSRTFKFQTPYTFPTINCPLYLMAQAPWLAVAGTSVLAIRSFNYGLMTAAAFLVWVVTWRFNLVNSASKRLLLVALLHLGYGMSFAYRCSRPDILGMTCLLLLLLSFTLRNRRLRELSILVLSALTFWIGLQVAFFTWFACLAALLILRRPRVQELVVVSLGLSLGLCSLIVFFAWKGALADFLPQIAGVMGRRWAHETLPIAVKAHRVIKDVLGSYLDDFSNAVLLLSLSVVLVLGWKRLSARTRALISYCLVLILGTPLLFDLLGHWAFYYSYMQFIPAILALFSAISELTAAKQFRLPSWLVEGAWVTAVAVAMAVGLPMRLALARSCCHLAPRAELLRMIRSNIRPDDVVLSDNPPFFEVKQVAKQVYGPNYSVVLGHMLMGGGHDFTSAEKRSISVLVIRPEQAQVVTNYFGGEWQVVTAPFGDSQDFSQLGRLPLVGSRLLHYATQPQNERYPVQIFRRRRQ